MVIYNYFFFYNFWFICFCYCLHEILFKLFIVYDFLEYPMFEPPEFKTRISRFQFYDGKFYHHLRWVPNFSPILGKGWILQSSKGPLGDFLLLCTPSPAHKILIGFATVCIDESTGYTISLPIRYDIPLPQNEKLDLDKFVHSYP